MCEIERIFLAPRLQICVSGKWGGKYLMFFFKEKHFLALIPHHIQRSFHRWNISLHLVYVRRVVRHNAWYEEKSPFKSHSPRRRVNAKPSSWQRLFQNSHLSGGWRERDLLSIVSAKKRRHSAEKSFVERCESKRERWLWGSRKTSHHLAAAFRDPHKDLSFHSLSHVWLGMASNLRCAVYNFIDFLKSIFCSFKRLWTELPRLRSHHI